MINPFSEIDARLSNIETLLLDLKHKPQSAQPIEQPDQLLTIQQAAEFLNLTVPTLYSYVHDHKVPYSKPGKRLYFSKRELLEWVKAGRKKTLKDIEAEADQYLTKTDKKRKGVNHE